MNLTPSQGTQVIGHIAELLDDLGVAEIARSRITRAAERDRADVSFLSYNASARITAVLKHSVGSPAATPSSLATNGSAT